MAEFKYKLDTLEHDEFDIDTDFEEINIEDLFEDEDGNLVDGETGEIIIFHEDRMLENSFEDMDLNSEPSEDLGEILNDTVDISEVIQDISALEEAVSSDTEQEVAPDENLYDADGNPIEFQIDGTLSIEVIRLDDILLPPRARRDEQTGIRELEKSIDKWGLIEPIRVMPVKGRYVLVHGLRRYIALKNLRHEEAVCIVDTTRRKEIIRYLEVLSNNTRPYTFFEQMDFGTYIEKKQPILNSSVIEEILGLEPGDYLKAKYIQAMDEFNIIGDIALGKLTIKTGFKKLERELDKAEKERLAEKDYKDGIFDPQDYDKIVLPPDNVQSTKDREILPRHIVDRVRARDSYTCQSCGVGHYQPEIISVFETHHIVPVAKGGSDNDNNLITLCANCHKVVTAYGDGKFSPPQERIEYYKNMIILGNIIKAGVSDGRTAYEFYIAKADREWLLT